MKTREQNDTLTREGFVFDLWDCLLSRSGQIWPADAPRVVFELFATRSAWTFDPGALGRRFRRGEAPDARLRILCDAEDLLSLLLGRGAPERFVAIGDRALLGDLLRSGSPARSPLSVRCGGIR